MKQTFDKNNKKIKMQIQILDKNNKKIKTLDKNNKMIFKKNEMVS